MPGRSVKLHQGLFDMKAKVPRLEEGFETILNLAVRIQMRIEFCFAGLEAMKRDL